MNYCSIRVNHDEGQEGSYRSYIVTCERMRTGLSRGAM